MHKKTKIICLVCSLLIVLFTNVWASQDFCELVKKGDIQLVKSRLQKNTDLVKVKDDRNNTPLHLASQSGMMDMAKLLISCGAEINAKEINQNTPLHFAVKNGNMELARFFLQKDSDINARNKDGFAPMHFAAMYNNKEILRLLIEKGAEIDIKDKRGATPLLVSIWRAKDIDAVRFLVEKGADINVSAPGSWVTPIAMAAQYGERDIVNYLIGKGAKIDEKSRFLVRFSVSKGLERLFLILLEKGANLNVGTNNGGSIMHFAAEGGSKRIITALAEKGFDLNSPDRYGWTPLHYAAFNGQESSISLFINKGAEINERNLSGKTAFNIASERGYNDISQFLASKGADRSLQKFPLLKGDYLGQKPPSHIPEIFALGIVSTPDPEHGSVTFSPDGKTIYWTGGYKKSASEGAFKVFSSHVQDNRWTPPQYAFFTGDLLTTDDVPFVSPDGNKIFFMSKRTVNQNDTTDKENYFMIDKTVNGWSEPRQISEEISKMTIRWGISVSSNGTLYFGSTDGGGRGASDIYRAKLINGTNQKPENIGEPINTESSEEAPFIAPDESYLIFGKSGERGQFGPSVLYISFKNKRGEWTKPQNMGSEINRRGAHSPYVSPDGKYLFFNSGRNGNYDIYWVDAGIIEKLKSKAMN